MYRLNIACSSWITKSSPLFGGGDLIEGMAPNLLSQLLDERLGRSSVTGTSV